VANLRKAKPKKKAKRPKFRYVVKVVETVEYLTAVESDTKLNWNRIKDIVELRRLEGKLSFNGVTDVDSWVQEAYCDGVEVTRNSPKRKTA
jgi:hypothetical protein